MKKNRSTIALLAVGSALLGGCNESPIRQPITGDNNPPLTVVADTAKAPKVKGPPTPFVPGTKVERILGNSSPSPADSRTR